MIAIPKELDQVLDFSKPGLPQLKKTATNKQKEIYANWKEQFEHKDQEKFRITRF